MHTRNFRLGDVTIENKGDLKNKNDLNYENDLKNQDNLKNEGEVNLKEHII